MTTTQEEREGKIRDLHPLFSKLFQCKGLYICGRIYILPDLEEEERRKIIQHEEYHSTFRKRQQPFRTVALLLLIPLYLFLPFSWFSIFPCLAFFLVWTEELWIRKKLDQPILRRFLLDLLSLGIGLLLLFAVKVLLS